jgi:hypothetical protein
MLVIIKGLFRGGDEPMADGVLHEACDLANLQPLHELGAMGLHGLDRKIEAMGDFLGTVALGNELKDLTLPGREVVRGGLLGADLNAALTTCWRSAD